jgi:zinc protease
VSTPYGAPTFTTRNGIPVHVETSDELPIVDVDILYREGAVLDPSGREGLTRLVAQMVRRGPRGMSAEQFDEAIEGLGATLAASVGSHSVRFHGAVIRRNLEPFLELVGRMLTKPGVRVADLARQKRKNEAELIDLRDHDRSLASRAFRRHLFGAHPYGIPMSGTLDTVSTFTRAEVADHVERLLVTGSTIVGVAGDVRADELAPMLERAFRDVRSGDAPRVALEAPTIRKGRRVLLVDKPQRTQTQVYIGTLGARVAQPDYHALLVANTAFGGTFTSRVVQEVRVERGWSYGAGSKLGADREREAWTLWSHPAATQVVDCLKLELELLDTWVEQGLRDDEVGRAKDYLVKSHAFDLETPAKRLDPRLETDLYALPADWHPQFLEHVRTVTPAEAHAAVGRHLATQDLSITLVATATDELLAALAALPGVVSVDRIDYARV